MPEKLTAQKTKSLIFAGKSGDYRDVAARGLVLRVKGSGVFTWCVRRSWKGKDWRLDLGPDWTLEEARDLATEVDRWCRMNEHPWDRGAEQWERHVENRRRAKAGLPPLVEPTAADRKPVVFSPPSITWQDALTEWRDQVAKTRRETTAYGGYMALKLPEFARFEWRQVSDITRPMMAEAIAAVHARGRERQAQLCAVAARSLFRYLDRDERTGRTAVEKGRMADLETPESTLDEDDDGSNSLLVPDGPQVGLLARAFRDEKSALTRRDRLAGLFLLYTVQRRRAVALAKKANFEACGDLGGLWKLPPLHRKTASIKARRGVSVGDHVVPLPPRAWAVVREAMALEPDCEWLFPSLRERRAGSGIVGMNPSRLTHLFAEVGGNAVRPHDVRRAFATTFGAEADLDDMQVKRVLDHAEGIASGDVTRAHYDFRSGEHKSWPVMKGWVAFVDRWEKIKD